jgi:hypothetical protein
VVPAKEVDEIEEGEWHQTPFGSCKSLSDSEVHSAISRYRGR